MAAIQPVGWSAVLARRQGFSESQGINQTRTQSVRCYRLYQVPILAFAGGSLENQVRIRHTWLDTSYCEGRCYAGAGVRAYQCHLGSPGGSAMIELDCCRLVQTAVNTHSYPPASREEH